MTLCNPGEMILTEDWTYPSALASARPWGVKAAPVKMDGEGMRADDLRKVLTEWDEKARGAPRCVSDNSPCQRPSDRDAEGLMSCTLCPWDRIQLVL